MYLTLLDLCCRYGFKGEGEELRDCGRGDIGE